MRGVEVRSGSLFSYVDLETRVPRSHPLRAILRIVNAALAELDEDFAAIYAPIGRPSIPPEQLLRALLLQAFYTVRSRAAADGTAGVQPSVPLVRRPWRR